MTLKKSNPRKTQLFRIKKILRIFIQVSLTIVIVAWLLKQIHFSELADLAAKLKFRTISTGFFLYFLVYLCRVGRIKHFLPAKIPAWGMLQIMIVHGLFNRLLPLRLGEGSYVFLARRMYKLHVLESSFTILYSRIYDLLATLITFVAAGIWISAKHFNPASWLGLAGVTILCLLVLPELILWVLKYLKEHRNFAKFANKFPPLRQLSEGWGKAKAISRQASSWQGVLNLSIFSILQWLLLYLLFYILIADLGLKISFIQIIFGASLSTLTAILPISSVGNFGTMELGWAAGFMLLGFSKESAIMTGIIVNLFTFLAVVILGLISILILAINKNKYWTKLFS